MTEPDAPPLRLPRMGAGVRWSDITREIEADQATDSDEPNPDEAA